ncbi:MAG: T9SS type A sorting domain-containing protein, partial [Ignavibacteriaceae bacterium]
GKILVSGICYVTISNSEFFAARFLSDGTPDSTFGTNGHFLTSYSGYEEECYTMALQNDGKIVLAGRTNSPMSLFFTRLNSNGSLDSSFGTNGYTVIDATIQQEAIRTIGFLNDGTIIGFGYGYQSTPYFGEKILMAKLDTSGIPITGFGNNGILFPSVFNDISTVYGLKVKNDSLFVTGYIYDAVNDYVLFISKLDQDGNAILTFGTNGITVTKQSPDDHMNVGYDLKISDDGKIYVCGTSGSGPLIYPRDFILIRYTQAGLPDTSFTSTGYLITSIGPDWDEANALDFQNDGKVVLAGFKSGFSTTGNNDIAIARYLVSDLLFPFIAVTPDSIVFDTTDVGSTSQKIIQVMNTGSAPLDIYDIYITDSVFTTPINSFIISPGESQSISIDFHSTLPGSYSGYIQIVSNASNADTFSIPVSGFAQDPTSIEGEQKIPKSFSLYENYPNPFNPSTKIKFSIPKSTKVVIKIYDVVGNEIETLVNEEKQAGTYEVSWYAENLPSGVYFYQLKAGSFVETKKMVLMK